MAPKVKNVDAGAKATTLAVAPPEKKAARAPQVHIPPKVTATPVTKAQTAVVKQPQAASQTTTVKVKARKTTSPVPITAKKQPRSDEAEPGVQPLPKKPKLPAPQTEASKRVAEEVNRKHAADLAAKKQKNLEEAQARARAVDKRRTELEAERKRLEEEEAKMADEETARLREDEEALAADVASEEQPEGDSNEDEEDDADLEEDEPVVGQADDVALPSETNEPTEEEDDNESKNIEDDDEAIPEMPPILTAQPQGDDQPVDERDPVKPTGIVEEEPKQPEQAMADEVPIQQEGDASEDDEVLEVTAAEVPPSTRPPRTRTTSAAPSRTNPIRKAKGVAVSNFPTFTVHAHLRARRRVAFSQDDVEMQEGSQVDHLANLASVVDHQANLVSEEHAVTASSAFEQPDEEIKVEGPEAEVDQADSTDAGDAMDKGPTTDEEVDVDEAARQRERKGKAKALPMQKKKSIARVTRRTGGPVLRLPE